MATKTTENPRTKKMLLPTTRQKSSRRLAGSSSLGAFSSERDAPEMNEI